jgi:cleavage and polyadenylation specificity factor subunit 1
MDELPLVLLGLRSAWREDPDCSPAELVYGTSLCLPGEAFSQHESRTCQPSALFLTSLQQSMRKLLPPAPLFHGGSPSFVPNNLSATGYVFVRRDSHKGPLQRPYTGPFKILRTNSKFFTVLVNGKSDVISVDRLKPAFVSSPLPQKVYKKPDQQPVQQNPVTLKTSRYGRQIRAPLRFA